MMKKIILLFCALFILASSAAAETIEAARAAASASFNGISASKLFLEPRKAGSVPAKPVSSPKLAVSGSGTLSAYIMVQDP